MKVRDLTRDQIRKGLRVKSLSKSGVSGTVTQVGVENDELTWILWDEKNEKGGEDYSGFRDTNCNCEVVVNAKGDPVYEGNSNNISILTQSGNNGLTHPHPAPDAAEPMVPNGDYRKLQLGGSLMHILDEDQSKHFMYQMTHPKPPTSRMIEARNKMRQWKESPGNKEYDSWVRAFDKD